MINPVPISQNQFKQIRKLKNRKYRTLERLYLCEGHRLLTAAISSGKIISDIVVTEKYLKHTNFKSITDFLKSSATSIQLCNEKQMLSLSDEVTPPGILFLVKNDLKDANDLGQCNDNKLIFLENVSDPGNLGTVIRSALWFNIRTILLSPDCVDPTNPKVVRASAGAIFSADIYTDVEPGFVFSKLTVKGYECTASTLADAISVNDWIPANKCILFIGSEASGLSDEIIKHCRNKVTIPGNEEMESLNLAIAAGILLYKLTEKETI